jgi:hypothetical protein
MNQGTQGYSLTKKTEGRKSRDTVSLKAEEVKFFKIFAKFCNSSGKSFYVKDLEALLNNILLQIW